MAKFRYFLIATRNIHLRLWLWRLSKAKTFITF